MEKLVHTAEGEIRPDNPFVVVGTRGLYVLEGAPYYWIITEPCVESNKELKSMGAIFVGWCSRYATSKKVLVQRSAHPADVSNMRIVEKGDKDYFEIEGFR